MEPASHRSDCWGRLNDAPDITPAVTILEGLPPGFREARRAMLGHLGLGARSAVLEAGCGPGTSLPDLVEWIGPEGRIAGIDPTHAFIALAAGRARDRGTAHASYRVGDIRQIEEADNAFDATFCDKILVHVSPIEAALAELARVTRPGGRVGAVEWYSQGMAIAADYALTRRILDGSAPAGALNPAAPLQLESLFAAAGLSRVESGAVVAETRQLVPAVRMMLDRRVQQAVELQAISADDGLEWLGELERRHVEHRFYWGAIVRWAVGTKGAAGRS